MEHTENTENRLPDNYLALASHYYQIECKYQAAIQQVRTKLEILDNEFRMQHSRNPIHQMQSRMKDLSSVIEKLGRRGLCTTDPASMEQLTDLAGIRVICSYLDDVYAVADLLTRQDDIHVLRVRDYIQSPKSNGYKSLHIILEVPVYLSDGKHSVTVEVQLRTIAMDCWASLEHHIHYKGLQDIPSSISDELKLLAESTTMIDQRFLEVREKVTALSADSLSDQSR